MSYDNEFSYEGDNIEALGDIHRKHLNHRSEIVTAISTETDVKVVLILQRQLGAIDGIDVAFVHAIDALMEMDRAFDAERMYHKRTKNMKRAAERRAAREYGDLVATNREDHSSTS